MQVPRKQSILAFWLCYGTATYAILCPGNCRYGHFPIAHPRAGVSGIAGAVHQDELGAMLYLLQHPTELALTMMQGKNIDGSRQHPPQMQLLLPSSPVSML